MYNFSGLIVMILGIFGLMFLLGVVCILIEKPWKKGVKLKKYLLGIVVVAIAVCMSLVLVHHIVVPNVSSYTGEFVKTNRTSRGGRFLPIFDQYIFWNGEEKRQTYYLDVFSKKEIFPGELEEGKVYTVYFDEYTNTIVRVDIVE